MRSVNTPEVQHIVYSRITSPRKERNKILSDDLDNTTSLLDLLLGGARDVSGLDNEGGVDSAFTEQLEVAELLEVDDGDGSGWGLNLSFWEGDELGLVVLF